MPTHAFMNHLVQSNRYNVQWATALRPSRLAAAGTLERFSSWLQWGAPWPPCAASVNPENHLWGWRWRPYHLRLATFRRVWCLWSMARTYATLSLWWMENKRPRGTEEFCRCYLLVRFWPHRWRAVLFEVDLVHRWNCVDKTIFVSGINLRKKRIECISASRKGNETVWNW